MAQTVDVKDNKTGKIIGGVIAAVIVLILVFNSFTTVNAGHYLRKGI